MVGSGAPISRSVRFRFAPDWSSALRGVGRSEAVIIEAQRGGALTVQQAEWVEENAAGHGGGDGFEVRAAEFRPRCGNHQRVRIAAAGERRGALREKRERVGGNFHHGIEGLFAARGQGGDELERGRVFRRVGVLFVGETPDAKGRAVEREAAAGEGGAEGARQPVFAMGAVVLPGGDDAGVGERGGGAVGRARGGQALAGGPPALRSGEVLHGDEVAFEISAGDAKAGREIGLGTDACVESERGGDLDQSAPMPSQTSASVFVVATLETRKKLMAIFASSALS